MGAWDDSWLEAAYEDRTHVPDEPEDDPRDDLCTCPDDAVTCLPGCPSLDAR